MEAGADHRPDTDHDEADDCDDAGPFGDLTGRVGGLGERSEQHPASLRDRRAPVNVTGQPSAMSFSSVSSG